MAVAFTPNIGLAKPDETEVAKNWTHVAKLAEDNNLIMIDEMDIPILAYTPSIIAPTVNPNVGAGQVLGEWQEIQGWIIGNFNVRFLDPGIVVGTGTGAYGIQLPTLADTAFHTVGNALNNPTGVNTCIGEGYYSDSSAVATSGTVALDLVDVGGVHYLRMMPETYAGKTVMYVGPTVPSSVADLDTLSGSFIYKRA